MTQLAERPARIACTTLLMSACDRTTDTIIGVPPFLLLMSTRVGTVLVPTASSNSATIKCALSDETSAARSTIRGQARIFTTAPTSRNDVASWMCKSSADTTTTSKGSINHLKDKNGSIRVCDDRPAV